MSPKNKKKLEIIRSKLDKLDNRLLSLIKYRTNLVKEVLKLKEFKTLRLKKPKNLAQIIRLNKYVRLKTRSLCVRSSGDA